MRHGFTLLEISIVLVVGALLAALVFPSARRTLDQIATDRASSEVLMFYNEVRMAAVSRATAVEIAFSEDTLWATYRGVRDSLFRVVPGPARFGVSMDVRRSIIMIYPTGLGWGAANTKLVFRRGEAAESLTTSRLGRIKRW